MLNVGRVYNIVRDQNWTIQHVNDVLKLHSKRFVWKRLWEMSEWLTFGKYDLKTIPFRQQCGRNGLNSGYFYIISSDFIVCLHRVNWKQSYMCM